MRHYSSLSEDEIHSLSLVYPTTANVMLCSQYDISRAGLHRLAVSHGWEKDRVTMAMIRARGDRITGSQVKWLCDNYATMPNSKLMLYLGIGELALARLAYKYKFKKSPEYRRQVGEKAYKMLTMMKVFAPQNEPIISSHSRGARRTGTIYQEIQRDAKGREQKGRGSAGHVVRGIGFVKSQRIRWVGEITANYKRYRFRSTDYQSVVSWLSMMRNRLAD